MLFRVGEKDRQRTVPWHDWLLATMAFALGLYHWVFEADLVQRAGQPNTTDIVVGSVVILLVFERRGALWGGRCR